MSPQLSVDVFTSFRKKDATHECTTLNRTGHTRKSINLKNDGWLEDYINFSFRNSNLFIFDMLSGAWKGAIWSWEYLKSRTIIGSELRSYPQASKHILVVKVGEN